MARGLPSGWLTFHENKCAGLAEAPALFCELMSGQTMGKSVLEVDEPATA